MGGSKVDSSEMGASEIDHSEMDGSVIDGLPDRMDVGLARRGKADVDGSPTGADMSLSILLQLDYPSIGYGFANSLEPASESLWELQDAPFEGPDMNSRNHHMWSSYSAYLLTSVAGLAIAPPDNNPPQTHMHPTTTAENSYSVPLTSVAGLAIAPRSNTDPSLHTHPTTTQQNDYAPLPSPLLRAHRMPPPRAASEGDTAHDQRPVLHLRPARHALLGSASASLSLAHGDASLSWARSGGVQTDFVAMGDTAVLDCSSRVASPTTHAPAPTAQGDSMPPREAGEVGTGEAARGEATGQPAGHNNRNPDTPPSPRGGLIISILFASFGTPHIAPSVSGYRADPACHAAASEAAVAAACVGRASCAVQARPEGFDVSAPDAAAVLAPATASAAHKASVVHPASAARPGTATAPDAATTPNAAADTAAAVAPGALTTPRAAAFQGSAGWCSASVLSPLRLLVTVQCSEPDALHVQATVPPSATALLHLPPLSRFSAPRRASARCGDGHGKSEGCTSRGHAGQNVTGHEAAAALCANSSLGCTPAELLSQNVTGLQAAAAPSGAPGRSGFGGSWILKEAGVTILEQSATELPRRSIAPGVELRRVRAEGGEMEVGLASGYYDFELLPSISSGKAF
jgi:hypothetical protein